MTTAQRTRELAEYFSGYGELNVAGETSAALTELSRMLEVALPGKIEAIANRHAGQDTFIRGGSRCHMVQEHMDRGVLLDAVRAITVSRDLAKASHTLADGRARAALLDGDRLEDQLNIARAEVDRLKAEAEARNKERRSIFCVHCNETYLTYTPEEATANPRLLAGVLDWSLRHDAECVANPIGIRLRDAEKRADRLPKTQTLTFLRLNGNARTATWCRVSKMLREKIEALPVVSFHVSLDTSGDGWLRRAEVMRIVAEHERGQKAPKPAWRCVPCNIEVHLGETFGDCPKCSKPMKCND